MSEIDATIIKKTQDTLGKYVKKPVLSEKLLKKPPFRFLYDVFNAVIKDTGVFEGLYTPEELNYENISDREAKMKFLQKMIDAIKLATSEPLTVRTSKIVAGHEPEKTNELLQLIGTVVEKKIDWKPAVETVNAGNSPAKPKEKLKDKESKEKKATDKSPKVVSSKKVVQPKAKTEVKEKTKPKEIKEKSSRKPSKTSESEHKDEKKLKSKSSNKETSKRTPTKNTEIRARQLETEPEIKIETQKKLESNDKLKEEPKKENVTLEKEPPETREDKIMGSPSETLSPSSTDFKKDERRASKRAEEILLTAAAETMNGGNESRRSSGRKRSSGKSRKSSAEKDKTSNPEDTGGKSSLDTIESLKTVAEEPLAEVTVKPSSKSQSSKNSSPNSDVKRESTFVREDSKEVEPTQVRPRTSLRPPSARPASARPGAPRRRDKNIEIILQPNDQIKLSGISVKLETFNSELEDDGENLVIIENATTDDQLEGNANKNTNVLVEDSLQQGHLVQQILETQKELVQGSTDIAKQQDNENDNTTLNSRQSSARQMNGLRDVIQNLTKSVNPLGKLMDFIPEDIDAMQLELAMWRDTYNQSSVELKKERSLTESVTEPMKNQLVTIESNIKEYREMIDGCRAKILQNADKIQKLLTNQ